MKIKDIVYGEEEISEPVLVELINSPPLQRLKGISQFGIPDEYYHKKGFSRFEHSVGVLILLRRLNAGIEEQISGLLHDVSHTTFSHVIDQILGNPEKEDYQDKTLLKVFEKTEIPKILSKYGFDYKKIAGIEGYSLLEQDIPKLCADRVDYSLREIAFLHNLSDALKIFNSLLNKDGRIAFDSIESANLLADYFILMNKEHWAEGQTKFRYRILADILKKAIEDEIISVDDFMRTDAEILSVLEESKDSEIIRGLNLLKKGFSLKKTEGKEGVLLKHKFRYIDPEVILDKKIYILSEISKEYKEILEKEKKNACEQNYFLIIPN